MNDRIMVLQHSNLGQRMFDAIFQALSTMPLLDKSEVESIAASIEITYIIEDADRALFKAVAKAIADYAETISE